MPGTRRDRCAAAARFAEGRDGVVSRHQLRALGLTRHDVRTEVRARRWTQPTLHTVAVVTGQLSQRQRWWVAVLETGCADAALDGLTALQAAGLEGIDGPVVASCGHGGRPRSAPAALVRVSRWRRPCDVVQAGVPRVRPGAAAIHAALWTSSDRHAALVLVATVQQRLTTPQRLVTELGRIARHRRRAFVRQVLGDVLDGAPALGELDFAGLCRRRGLPTPTRQAVRSGPRGRWHLDVHFEEYGVTVEIDGIAHLSGLAPLEDALRQNALVIGGELVLRIPLLGLRLAPAEFLDQVARALSDRGWRAAA